MRFSSAALVAGFLATSSAFLLPPSLDEIKEEFKDARFRGTPKHFKDLVDSLLEEQTTVVDLECPGCPFAVARSEDTDSSTGIESVIWEHDVENTIHLEFATRDNDLVVNGVHLFPLDVAIGQMPIPLMAHQIKTDVQGLEYGANVRLSFVASILPPISSHHRDNVKLNLVELTILKMNEIPVKVDTIVLKVIKTPEDNYVIAQVEQIPFEETPGAEACEGTRPWSMCRIKAIIADKVARLMHTTKQKAHKVHNWVKAKTGCGKFRGFSKHPHPHSDHPHEKHRRPHHDKEEHGPHHHEKHPRPHHNKKPCHKGMHKDHHKGHRHRFHRVSHMIHQTLRFFVVPALLGIIGGLTASAIGMLAGQAIVYMWFRTYRNGERGPLRIYEREIALINEEQNRLLDEKEATLPQYEDAPAYQETLSRDVEAAADSQENEKQ